LRLAQRDGPAYLRVPRSAHTRSMLVAFALLVVAIAIEVVSTAALPKTDGFRDPVWAVAVVAGYAVSIWLLSLVVQRLPVSVTYAVWSGIGTAAIAIVGAVFLGESWNPLKLTAIGLIVVGVVVLNLQSAH
jgi:small multidrug resistance pump